MAIHNNDSTDLPSTTVTWKQVDSYLKGMPKKLRYFVQCDCAISWCPKSVYKMYRQHGADETIEILRDNERRQTLEAYGPDHPALGNKK